MRTYSLALYDAFSEVAFGGSQAAIITDAAGIKRQQRQQIAREIGMPACAFVDDHGENWIKVQFMSTLMELPMCGHGTVCLLTHMLETGLIQSGRDIELRLSKTTATVSVNDTNNGRFQVMLDITPPDFVAAPPHSEQLLKLLGLDTEALSPTLPLETARGDFIHLVVPLVGLDAMRSIRPNFSGMVEFCHAHGIETIAVFCLETEDPTHQLHLRDFCPAVGVSESAAAGTTNAALTSYLLRHSLISGEVNGELKGDVINCLVHAEQGIELGRPSSIQSRVTLANDGRITRLQVGGIATRVFQGEIYL
jgi:trans-2,3-dihydro-3-hydroxyanthranilate isomerase